ncbi:MAG: transcriptional regulator [Candidatus Zixiibacteriota bacterium]
MSAKRDTKFLVPEVDKLIHEPARFSIMALLSVIERADFLFVKNQTGLTPGNLSSHLTKLETAGYVEITKEFVGKMPKTFLKLSKKGRSAFDDYRTQMKRMFK